MKYCKVCDKDSHDTKDCWGSGTVAVGQGRAFPAGWVMPDWMKPKPMSVDDFIAKYYPNGTNNDIRFS